MEGLPWILSPLNVENHGSDHFTVGNSECLREGKVVLLSTFAQEVDKVVWPGNNRRLPLPSYHQGGAARKEEAHICEEDDTLPLRLLTPLACNKL